MHDEVVHALNGTAYEQPVARIRIQILFAWKSVLWNDEWNSKSDQVNYCVKEVHEVTRPLALAKPIFHILLNHKRHQQILGQCHSIYDVVVHSNRVPNVLKQRNQDDHSHQNYIKSDYPIIKSLFLSVSAVYTLAEWHKDVDALGCDPKSNDPVNYSVLLGTVVENILSKGFLKWLGSLILLIHIFKWLNIIIKL